MNKFKYYEEPHFVGKSPDISAYEFDDQNYWIPGFRYPHASTPVPPNGAVAVQQNADLMFLGGYEAVQHHVWFGSSPDKLTQMKVLTDTNIFSPPSLVSGKKYFWRVDAVSQNESHKGSVWSFTVK